MVSVVDVVGMVDSLDRFSLCVCIVACSSFYRKENITEEERCKCLDKFPDFQRPPLKAFVCSYLFLCQIHFRSTGSMSQAQSIKPLPLFLFNLNQCNIN